ncbi:MAG: glycosyltransferase family 9 protein [Bacteroidota bacterium]|nr:glycosyltransferase family 9 protein [Bacteroidota bacterium]
MKIIISRTDNLGDVILTLPLAGILKERIPNCEIYFLGKSYTKPIIDCCKYIDFFLDKADVITSKTKLNDIKADAIIYVYPDKEIAKIAYNSGIKLRIGTGHRLFHLFYCNKLIFFSRRKSDLHESQLNLKLLKGLGLDIEMNTADVGKYYGFDKASISPSTYLNPDKFNLIIHPKSKGSAREWPLSYYQELIKNLDKNKYNILVTGTEDEGIKMIKEIPDFFANEVTNLCGKLSMKELIDIIAQSDALLACSTGPLHIAAAFGVHAIGIYPPMIPIHPGRWAPIGPKVKVFFLDKFCIDCKVSQDCSCIKGISIIEVEHYLYAIQV